MEAAEIKAGLSDTMVGAETISPLFPFSFYGHVVNGFYITTHGILSLSPRLHDYIYKTQYIAPLGIKLVPSRSNSSTISVLSLPDRLTVEWSNVSVMADAEHPAGGAFTFQVTAAFSNSGNYTLQSTEAATTDFQNNTPKKLSPPEVCNRLRQLYFMTEPAPILSHLFGAEFRLEILLEIGLIGPHTPAALGWWLGSRVWPNQK